MTRTSLAQKLVADFWHRVGYEEAFPRQLERAIMSTVPVFVIKVHRQRLDTNYIEHRLKRRGVHLPVSWGERRMNGCLVAFKGEGAIFVDGTLSPEDTRVVIGHEFGHFLGEYEWPRLRAVRHLGERIVEVLDGDRPPAGGELLGASLTDVPLGVYTHYMDRCGTSDVTSRVSHVEETANIVGAELLAPRHVVLAEMARMNVSEHDATVELLENRFGLPKTFATWYAGRVEQHLRTTRSFCDILGFARTTTA